MFIVQCYDKIQPQFNGNSNGFRSNVTNIEIKLIKSWRPAVIQNATEYILQNLSFFPRFFKHILINVDFISNINVYFEFRSVHIEIMSSPTH